MGIINENFALPWLLFEQSNWFNFVTKGSLCLFEKDIQLSVEEIDGILFINDGKVNYFLEGRNGKEKLAMTMRKGCFIGEEKLFLNKVNSGKFIVTEDLKGIIFSKETFKKLLLEHSVLSQDLYHFIIKRIKLLSLIIQEETFYSPEQRLARFLYRLDTCNDGIPYYDNEVCTKLSHDYLAKVVGTDRVTISKALSDLKKSGIIEICDSKLYLLDRKALLSYKHDNQ